MKNILDLTIMIRSNCVYFIECAPMTSQKLTNETKRGAKINRIRSINLKNELDHCLNKLNQNAVGTGAFYISPEI
jgi:hypothetical protein